MRWMSTAFLLVGFGLLHSASPSCHGEEAAAWRLNPRPIEKPLFAYRLLPRENELRDGDAATILLRINWDQRSFVNDGEERLKQQLQIPFNDENAWIEAGPGLPDHVFQEMRRAAYRRSADWQFPIHEQPGSAILVPELQGSRLFVNLGLSVWIRHHAANGDFRQATEGVLVGLAVARHFAATPFQVCNLVAISQANAMLDRLEELIQNREAPNYYWPLTALPENLLDVRRALDFDRSELELSVKGLNDLDEERTEFQWLDLARRLLEALEKDREGIPTDQPDGFTARTLENARSELPELLPESRSSVAEMSDSECLVRWIVAKGGDLNDEVVAATALPPRLAVPRLREIETRNRGLTAIRPSLQTLSGPEWPLRHYLLQLGLRRRIALLRTVEAIRHHTATRGSPPAKLADVMEPPIPNDPSTDAPFDYSIENGSVKISGMAAGREAPPVEIRIEFEEEGG